MGRVRDAVAELPMPLRWALTGAVLLGGVGAVTGLVVGLLVYAPTAWAAALETGFPAALLGGVLGLAAGWTLAVRRRRGPSGG